jgi:multidrug efflux pump
VLVLEIQMLMRVRLRKHRYKGKVTVSFSEFKFREGINTSDILEEIRAKVKAIAGATVTVEKDANGPPAGYPISIQLTGTDYDLKC